MQLLATAEEMRHADSTAINALKIPGLVLMENAGRAFVDHLEHMRGPLDDASVAVVCGKGNNGGDGFVIARHLVNRGATVTVLILGDRSRIGGDAKTNLDALEGMVGNGVAGLAIVSVASSTLFDGLPVPDVVVDAIFGTGFSGMVEGIGLRAIEWINSLGTTVASVDIASGTNANNGAVEGVAVRATFTVAMGLAKVGQYLGAGRDHQGTVVAADISIPGVVFARANLMTSRVEKSDVTRMLPRRPVSAHKYSVGKVFVLAGSRRFTGAPFMCAQSAMRAGAGGVVLGIPGSIKAILARKVTEVMIEPLDETGEGTVARSALEGIRRRAAWADVIALGPGLSDNPETGEVVRTLLAEIDRPIVLDADGLNATSMDALRARKSPTILTPHIGELARLLGRDAKELENERATIASTVAADLGAIVVCKGAPTATGTPAGYTILNASGNPGMASAGMGDVLTGIIAGLWAQGMTSEDAAVAGVYIHGFAADLAIQQFGMRGIMAQDVIDLTGVAIARVGGE